MVSEDANFVPTKANSEMWIDGTTYYAKFEYNLTSMTITKTGVADVDHHVAKGNSEAEKQSYTIVTTISFLHLRRNWLFYKTLKVIW